MNEILDKIPYNDIHALPQWQKWSAVGGVLVLIFGVYFYFFHSVGVKKINTLENELKTIENRLTKTRQLQKKLPELKKKIAVLEKELSAVTEELPSEREIPYFLKTISEEGKNAGLEILLFQPAGEAVHDFYASVPVKMEMSGSYHNVMTFFDRVRNLPRIVDIGNITMNYMSGDKKAPVLKTNCFATTYKYIEGAEKKEAPKK